MLYGSGRAATPPQPAGGTGAQRGRGQQAQVLQVQPEAQVQQAPGRGNALSIDGLPFYKGPYGPSYSTRSQSRNDGVDGTQRRRSRNHPLLKGLNAGPLGNAGRPAAMLTNTLCSWPTAGMLSWVGAVSRERRNSVLMTRQPARSYRRFPYLWVQQVAQ